jgi:hypothetical protein
MSVINNVERYIKRYDYLMDKRERRIKHGKQLSEDENEELRKIRPNVFTPIMMMFELLHDIVKTNQDVRKSSKQRNINQTGGATPTTSPTKTDPKNDTVVAESAAAAAAAAAAVMMNQPDNALVASAPPLDDNDNENDNDNDNDNKDDNKDDDGEARRLSELEESLLPLLTKIIVYIEENKKAEKKKDDEEEEEEKYPDIGTTAKNSAILVIRRIKKWWNDLISGGTSDLSSKINLKKAIPQLANNPADMNKLNMKAEELNKLAEKATDVIHEPLKKIERILSNDVRDIASSSVEGIMNALSLIPGIGTTLQLWRLLQNVIVIMSKSVTTMAGAKNQGTALKLGVQGLQGDFQKMAADPGAMAGKVAGGVGAGGAMDAVSNVADPGAMAANMPNVAGAGGAMDALSSVAGAGGPMGALSSVAGAGGAMDALSSVAGAGGAMDALSSVAGSGDLMKAVNGNPIAAIKTANKLSNAIPGGVGSAMKMISGGSSHTNTGRQNHLRSVKKYRREYKQSLREIKKTRKNILRIIKNMI